MSHTIQTVHAAALVFANISVLVVVILVSYRRIRRKQFESERRLISHIDLIYTQIEALLSLRGAIRGEEPFPPTRGWAASPDFLLHVWRIATDNKPRVIVECSSGTSTLVLGKAVKRNGSGHVFSLEHDPVYAERTRQMLRRNDLDAYATVVDAPLRRLAVGDQDWMWYDTENLPASIDLLVIDGPPTLTEPLARFPAIPLLRAHLSPNAVVVLDDAARAGEQQVLARWTSEFGLRELETLKAEKGIAVFRIETLGKRPT